MATTRKMYKGPGPLILLIPVGLFFCLFLVDFIDGMYQEYVLKRDTKEILKATLDRDGLSTVDEYKKYAVTLYKEKGYDTQYVSFIPLEGEQEAYILVNTKYYLDILGTLTFGLFRNDQDLVHVAYKGYYNEYKETVIELYNEDDEEFDYIDDYEDEIDEEIVIG